MKKTVLLVLTIALLLLTGAALADSWIVTFNPNDRDAELTQVEVTDGSTVEKPADPARTDYAFTGWYTDKRGVKHPYDFSQPVTGDLFLYAGWTSEKVRVTFDMNYEGGDVTSVSMDGGTAIAQEQIPQAAERDNYLFTGWYTDANSTSAYDFSKTLTKNMTLYAGWQQQRAAVSFDLGYFGAGNTPDTQILDLTAGEKAAAPADPVRGEEGDWHFDGWYTGSGKNECLFDFESNVTGDMTLTAHWTQLRSTVTYDMNADDMPDVTEKVLIGEKAAAADGVREGYDFAGWYYDRDCTIPADLKNTALTEDITVYAAWKPQERTITYDYNYQGAPEKETAVSLYDAITVEPDEPKREDDEFIGWFLDATMTEPFVFGDALKDNLYLYAGWEKDAEALQAASATEVPAEADAVQASAQEENLIAEDGKFILRFHNADGSVWLEETVAKNKYSSMKKNGVTYPEREGYQAMGWYTTQDCVEGTEFNANARVTAGMNLYVKWVKEYVFEAELTQLTDIPIGDTGKTEDKLGYGESSNPKGLYLIEWDCYNAGASGDYYVSYLYNPGTYLEFCITAAEDVENATLVLRLTPELHDMYFATGGPDGTASEKNGYKIYVNPVYSFNSVTNTYTLEAYDQVCDLGYDLTGAITKDEDPNYTMKRAFEDYEITAKLSLKAGENTIRLVTENTHDYGGSMHAAAPMVDCIKIYTNAQIGWTEGREYTQNLDGIDVRWPAKKQ